LCVFVRLHKEKVFDDGGRLLAVFRTTTRRAAGVLSKVYPRRPGRVPASVYRKYIENDAHNIIGSKLSNTEKIERLAELLNKCALDPRLPALRGDDIQIGLTVNRIGSHEVDKYVFVFGGARQSRARPTRPCCAGSSRRSWSWIQTS
jgi:hypothetical protein